MARTRPHRLVRVITSLLVTLAVAAVAASPAAAAQDPVEAAIGNAQIQGTITQAQATAWRTTYVSALSSLHSLSSTNATQLRSAVRIVRGIAKRNALSAARMPFIFLVLKRNVQWWTAHRSPTAGSQGEPGAKGRVCTAPTSHVPTARAARISFAGSGIVFEYYPGLGLQLQVNGTFGNANALLHTANPVKQTQGLKILDEMRPLIAPRSGLDTWEYEFPFGGGVPPWASGLSQATAIEAYTTAATLRHRPADLTLALSLSALFARRTPIGVRVPLGADGNWYALYSFAPGQQVLNADLDANVALYDLEQATHNPAVGALQTAGLRALTRRIHGFDTGRWSLYSAHGPLADLNYHVLNRDEAKALCQRTPTKPPTTTPAGPPSTGGGVSAPAPTTTTPAPTPPVAPTTPIVPTPTTTVPAAGGGVPAPPG
jgi:hypothetical protein